MTYQSTRLSDTHCFDFFDCSEPDLNRWAQQHAHEDQRLGRSATHVWTDAGGEYVVGYFTLLPSVTRAEESGLFAALKPKRYQGAELPGVLLGKMALDKSLRGCGRGVELLADAMLVASDAMDLIGGLHVVVDPMSDRPKLRAWYREVGGFAEIPGTDRLYLSLRP